MTLLSAFFDNFITKYSYSIFPVFLRNNLFLMTIKTNKSFDFNDV